MSTTPEQMSAAAKLAIESQVTLFSSLAQKTFAGFEKLIELNLSVAKTSMEESHAVYNRMLASKEPNTFFSGSSTMTQPTAQRAMSYAQQVAGIATEIQSEFSKAAELQVAENQRKLAAMMEQASKSAPAGSESAIAMMTSMMSKATEGYEQITRTTRQAVESMEGNIAATVDKISQTTKAAAKPSKK